MYRAQGPSQYLGSGLSDVEDPMAGKSLPDVDMIAIQYYNPNRAVVPQRIANYDTELVEREQRINGLGAPASGRLASTYVGGPQAWMHVANRANRRIQSGRPAVRQRFVDGLGATTPVISSTQANTPYMVVSDPNAPFVLYAQNAESAPFQPFALYRKYQPAAENARPSGSGRFPVQWGYVGELDAAVFSAPHLYAPAGLAPAISSGQSSSSAPPAISWHWSGPAGRPSKFIYGIAVMPPPRPQMQESINRRKKAIESGRRVGGQLGLRIPATVPTVLEPTRVFFPQEGLQAPKTVANDPLTKRSLFVEY